MSDRGTEIRRWEQAVPPGPTYRAGESPQKAESVELSGLIEKQWAGGCGWSTVGDLLLKQPYYFLTNELILISMGPSLLMKMS